MRLAPLLLALALAAPASAQGLIRDINPGSASSSPKTFDRIPPHQDDGSRDLAQYEFVVFEGEVYFQADDGVHGVELWRTNGTAEGTTLFADANPGAASAYPTSVTVYGSQLYFVATFGQSQRCLFRSDGTAAGTECWISQDAAGNVPRPISVANGVFYLQNGSQLWATTGDAAGPVMVRNDAGADVPLNGNSVTVFGTRTIVTGAPSAGMVAGDRSQHFRTDGVTAEALDPETCCRERTGQSYYTNVSLQRTITDGSLLYFGCDWSEWSGSGYVRFGFERCRSGGGFDDTRADDLQPGPASSHYLPYGQFGGDFFFQANVGTTSALRTLAGGALSPDIFAPFLYVRIDLAAIGDRTFIGAQSGDGRSEDEARVWRTDGTPAGTTVLWDPPADPFVRTVKLASDDARLFIAAYTIDANGVETDRVLVSDGTAAPVEVGVYADGLYYLTPYNGGVVFAARETTPSGVSNGVELYGYAAAPQTVRQEIQATGTYAFGVSEMGDALPVTVEVDAVAGSGTLRVSVFDQTDTEGAGRQGGPATLRRFVRVVPDPSLLPFSASVTLSYADADLDDAGVADETTLGVVRRDGTEVDVLARDPGQNTLTVGPVTGSVDLFVVGQRATATDGEERPGLALVAAPNPSHGAVTLSFSLAAPAADVRLSVVDVLGREVAAVTVGPRPAGAHAVTVDGAALAPGVYHARLTAGGQSQTARLTVVR